MTNLASLFINNLLPILLIAGIGYLCGKYLGVEPRSLSRVIFYVFSPCLIFDLLTNSQLSGVDMLRMIGFTGSVVICVAGATFLLGKVMKLNRRMLAAVVLTTMSMNAGNFGLSLNLFAFGEAGLAQASIFFVTTDLFTYSLGVMIASLGTASLKQSLLKMLTVPANYAVILALVFWVMAWHLPVALERTTSTLGGAAIPSMLILLGLQLQRNQRTHQVPAMILSNGMRLIGGAAFGLLLGTIFGLQGVAFQAGVVEAATPTAVLATVLSTEFDIEPAFVTSVVFTTTLLSPLTLTPLLAYLGA
ncbi:MAG: AEC family transporter [Anaerolineales bacterium]|nr:AEC family transporter [Anaerolineales bacterium]